MWDHFDQSATSVQAQKRFHRSIVAAAVICATSSAAMVAATHTTTKRVEEDSPVIIAPLRLPGAAAESVEGAGPGHVTGTGTGIGGAPVEPPPAPPPIRPEPLTRPIAMRSDERPRYSLAARRKGIEGTVVVAFDVLEDGRVANVRVVSGPAELHASVLEAAQLWRYKPARRGGKAVRYRMTRAVAFRLEDA